MKASTSAVASRKPKKTRSSTPRSRSGCQTCRQRHVKCDETRPSCLRCTRSGWPCDGYESTVATQGALGYARQISVPSPALSITSYSIPFRIPGSQKDRQVLHYFCVQGSLDISGYLGSSFWSRTVLQASHDEPVVRQALVSLSSLHLDFATSDGVGAKNDILKLHGKALGALRKRMEAGTSGATKTALICCILFCCFESALGNSETAMQHLQNGINILSSYQKISRDDQEEDGMPNVSAMFERLDLQATIFDDSRTPVLDARLHKGLQELKDSDSQIMPFERLEHAHGAFIKVQNWLFHFVNENLAFKDVQTDLIPAEVLSEKQNILESFVIWKKRFEPLEHQSAGDNDLAYGSKILLILWLVSKMLLSSDYPHDETVFGACPNPEAESVLELASHVIQATAERNASAEAAKSPCRNFSSEIGVVAPLFMLAMKCSDESIGEKAANLLRISHRREGLYDSQKMASILRQFQAAQSQRTLDSTVGEEWAHESLETTFEAEINRVVGGMDGLADLVHSTLSA